MGEAKQFTDAEISAWGLSIGERYHVDDNFSNYCVYDGVVLTPQNSDEMEQRYLRDLVAEREKLGMSGEEYEKWLCLNDLYYLAKWPLKYEKLEFYFHWPMCQFEQGEVDRPGSRTNVQMPRVSCKTTIFTIAGSVRDILRNPNIRIAIWSHDVHHAGRKLAETKERMIQSEVLAKHFPEWMPTDKKSALGTAYWTTPARTMPFAEHTLEAAGILGGQAGFHHDKLVLDDAWSDKSVTSQKVIDDTKRRVADIENMVITTGTRIMAVNTRWAHNDPSEVLRDNAAYVHLRASILDKNGKNIYPPIRPDGLGDTTRKLHQQAIDDEYHFMCQKMNNPASTTQGFDKMWFKTFSGNELYRAYNAGEITIRTVLLTDLAGTATSTSNYAAGVVLANDNLGRHVILAAYRRKMTPLIFTQFLFALADRWRVQMIVRQLAPLENAMKDSVALINRERGERGERTYAWYDFRLGGRALHKTARIDALSFPFQKGILFFNRDTNRDEFETWHYDFEPDDVVDIVELEKQLMEHPHSGQDNLADALSMFNDPVISAPPTHIEGAKPSEPMTSARFKQLLDASPDPREEQIRMRREKMIASLEDDGPSPEWPMNIPGL